MQRSFSVKFSPSDGVFATKYPALVHLPCIFDSRPGFHRLANRYLVERGLGVWMPPASRWKDSSEPRLPTAQSMRNYADWLANFLEWTDVRSVDLATCSYSVHVAGRYQGEMLQGTWSRDGKGKRPKTVNLRVQQACDFLTWMVDRGLRPPFAVPYETVHIKVGSATSAHGHHRKQVQVRVGKVKETTAILTMPTDEQVKKWLDSVRCADVTAALMCETILLTAMRREEVVCLRTNLLPELQSDWVVVNPLAPPAQQQLSVTIRLGTKGQMFGYDEHGDKIGPERTILIPVSLAKRWHEYMRTTRNGAFAKRLEGVRGAKARRERAAGAVHLFLRAEDGERFTGKQLYDAWTSYEGPFEGWSPHQGRHWWACTTLWRELKKQAGRIRVDNESDAAFIESTALSIIRLQIAPQLGHASESTTMIYLRWVINMVSTPVSLDDAETWNRDS